MKLIITRHGETIDNVKRIVQGHLGGKLSKRGEIQAKKLAERLKKEKIDEIYSSDLKRAADTAKEIAKFHKHLKIQFDKRLRERFFGKFQGKPVPEKNWDWIGITKGIETDSAMTKRFKEFFKEIHKKHKNENVLIVTHGGMKRVILIDINNSLPNKTDAIENFGNTSVSIFRVSKGKIIPELLNCTMHLDEKSKKRR
jgi:2,3-bisphosphoglycerate-dependent phosphoglycerate mutase